MKGSSRSRGFSRSFPRSDGAAAGDETSSTRARLSLHLVTDPRLSRERLLDAICLAADNGVDWVQVRDHGATAGDLYEFAKRVVAICRSRGVRVAVNDRVDVALAVDADGVQLGNRSLGVAAVRRIAPGLGVGRSVHDGGAAVQAEADGADWLTFGHVFSTPSHPDAPAQGIGELRRVIAMVQIPIIAIGGIGPENVDLVRAAGASGIAVISAILGADDSGTATRELRSRLDLTPFD